MLTESNRQYREISAAFSLVELLVVLAIIATLMGLLATAVQRSREAARRTTCLNKIRSLGHAALAFETASRHLPPGVLGALGLVEFEEYDQAGGENYWKNFQYTSALALVLPYSDESNLADDYHPVAFHEQMPLNRYTDPSSSARYSWFGEIPNHFRNAETQLSMLICPSDHPRLEDIDWVVGALQPVLHNGKSATAWTDLQAVYEIDMNVAQKLGKTNYVACTGVGAGLPLRSEMAKRENGLFGSRPGVQTRYATDGMSKTIMFGEHLGEIKNGERYIVQNWLTGGLGRARVSETTWEARLHPMIGNLQKSHIITFSSAHSGGATFVFGDGRAEFISAEMDWRPYFAMAAMADRGAWSQVQ